MTQEIRYITRFLFFVTKPIEDSLLYCSGVNVIPFLPITKGRHKAMNNPVIRGLQNVNLDIRDMALARGAEPITYNGPGCEGLSPTEDIWYTEQILFKNPPADFAREIIEYAVVHVLKKMDKAIMLNAELPERALQPVELEAFLELLCHKYGSNT